MGDRWSTDDSGGYYIRLDGRPYHSVAWDEAKALGLSTPADAARLIAEVLNADTRTNPPKVEMVPWAEVDTRPGKHLPAGGGYWADFRTQPNQSLVGYEPGRVLTYYPGQMVPVRSSDGEA